MNNTKKRRIIINDANVSKGQVPIDREKRSEKRLNFFIGIVVGK